jgi:hypothetical protein
METLDKIWKATPWIAGAFLLIVALLSLLDSMRPSGPEICWDGRSNSRC